MAQNPVTTWAENAPNHPLKAIKHPALGVFFMTVVFALQPLAGAYRLAAYVRGYGITKARVGLSSTATDIRADFSAVC